MIHKENIPTFSGNKIIDCFPRLGENVLHLPRYPKYEDGFHRIGDFNYYFQRSQQYLTCQTARFTLLGAGLHTLVEDTVVDLSRDLPDYWTGFFRSNFGNQIGELIKYSGHYGFIDIVAARPDFTVISPHPYDSAFVPAKQYYLDDPTAVVDVNCKGKISKISSHALLYETFSPEDFASDEWKGRWDLPFVIKITQPSGGGDGVQICKNRDDILSAKKKFDGLEIKIEPFVGDSGNNYNVQVHVSPDGTISFIGGSVQKVSPEGKYGGNYFDFGWLPDENLWEISKEIGENCHNRGYYGVCGPDIMETPSGKRVFVDPNMRLNGSTPFFLMQDYFKSHFNRPCMESGYFAHPTFTPAELLEAFKSELESGELTLTGIYYGPQNEDDKKKVTRIYAAIASEGDPEKHGFIKENLAKKGLLSGIHL